MRDIKFRAFDKVSRKMSPPFSLFGEFTLIGAVFAWIYHERDYTECNCGIDDLRDLVVMQYTGLKDVNGVEIYEGDILKFKPYHNLGHCFYIETGSVEYGETGDSDGYCYGKHYEWVACGNSLADIADSDFPEESYCEVIGNIHENPELLK